jgi:hypothetical protein
MNVIKINHFRQNENNISDFMSIYIVLITQIKFEVLECDESALIISVLHNSIPFMAHIWDSLRIRIERSKKVKDTGRHDFTKCPHIMIIVS